MSRPRVADPGSPPAPPTRALAERGLTSAEVRSGPRPARPTSLRGRAGVPPGTSSAATLFTFFNGILGVLFVVMMIFGNWRDALFGWVIVINSSIGIYQEMRAKLVLDRLNLLTAPAAKVVRDGQDADIPIAQVVLGDVVRIASGRPDRGRRGRAGVARPGGGRVAPHRANPCRCRRRRGAKLLSGSFVVAGQRRCSSPPPWAATPTRSASPARASATRASTPT